MKIIQIVTISILTLGSIANVTAAEQILIDQPVKVAPKACNKTQGCCSKMKQGGMKKSEKMKKMMAMKKYHMKNMEESLANIEALLKELVELQKAQVANTK